MDMKLLFDFFDEANFQSNRTTGSGGLIKGINFNDAANYTFWIAQLDTLFESNQYIAYTSEQQNIVKDWIESDILAYLPANKRSGIYLASLGEKWPVGNGVPVAYGTILNLKRQSGIPGLAQMYDRNIDGVLEASILSVRWKLTELLPDVKSVSLQENLSALAAPFDVGGSDSPLHVPLAYKTCLHENSRTSYLTPIDVKLLWVPASIGAGKKALDYFGMPSSL